MEKDRTPGQNGKDGDRRPMKISYEEWERRFQKAFNKNKNKDKDNEK